MEDKPSSVVNTLVVIDTNANYDTSRLTTLMTGVDFFMNPSFSPDDKQLSWHQWYRPDVLWEGCLFYIQEIKINSEDKIQLGYREYYSGSFKEVSASSTGWVDAETASFNNDESEFWNPRVCEAKTSTFRPILDKLIGQDFDKSAWSLDNASWCVLNIKEHTRLSYAYYNGHTVLYVIKFKSGKLTEILSPYVDIDHLRRIDDNPFLFLDSLADAPSHIALGKVLTSPDGEYSVTFEVLKSTIDKDQYSKTIISEPEPITVAVDGEPLYAVLYRPKNPEYEGSSIKGELPPCVVGVHGGPTSMTNQGLSWRKQCYTSRGFA